MSAFNDGLGRSLRRLASPIRSFFRERSGSIALEYTVIAALIATAIVASLGTIAGPLGRLLTEIGTRAVAN